MPVDPIMSALPALADLIATPGRAEAAPLRAQVLTLPTQLAGAPTPVSVSGIVAESPIPGQLRIATAIGEVQLHTPTELPAGRTVTIITRPNLPTEVFLLPNPGPAPPAGRQAPAGSLPTGAPAQTGRTAPLPPAAPGIAAPLSTPAGAAPPLNAAPPFSMP